MKKMLCVLSPLLCSSLLYHQHVNGMQQEKVAEDVVTQKNADAPTQEELNVMISSMIIESSSIKNVEETKEVEAVSEKQPSGFGWITYFQSFAYSKSNLAVKTLEGDMFQPNNKDHMTLLEQALSECVEQKQDETLLQIFNLVNQKHKDAIKIDTAASQNIYKHLNGIKDNKIANLRSSTIEKHKATMANVIGLITTLDEQHLAAKSTIWEMIKKNEEESAEKHTLLTTIKEDYRSAMGHAASISDCTLPKRHVATTTGFSHTAQKEMLTDTYTEINKYSFNLKHLAEQLKLEEAKPLTIENKK